MIDTAKRMKRLVSGQEKIFAGHLFNNILVSKIDKELQKQ